MTKQEKTALNMARFIRSQTLTLLEKLNELDADEQADICESLHEAAGQLTEETGRKLSAVVSHRKQQSGCREQTSPSGRVSGF